MEKELSIREEAKSESCLLHLSGDITKTSGDTLLNWRNWEDGLGNGMGALILDFSGVAYINSAGIAALIRLVRMGAGGLYRTGCYGLIYHYEKLFHMVGLTKYMTIYPSQWAALDGMRKNTEGSKR